jgi:hypothetical protein
MNEAQFKTSATSFATHEFCQMSFNKNASNWNVEVSFQDVPEATRGTAKIVFETDKQLFDVFAAHLKALGWRMFWNLSSAETYVGRFLHLPELDAQYEYAVWNCTVNLDEQLVEKVIRLETVFDLGKTNKSMIFTNGPKPNFWGYDAALEYFEREQWEFMHQKDYPTSSNLPQVRLRLRYYKRPVNAGKPA